MKEHGSNGTDTPSTPFRDVLSYLILAIYPGPLKVSYPLVKCNLEKPFFEVHTPIYVDVGTEAELMLNIYFVRLRRSSESIV